MKKLFLLILVSLTMGCYAQTEVTEYVIGDYPNKGGRSYCLCVMNGYTGVLKFKDLNLAYQAKVFPEYGTSNIKLISQNPNDYPDAYFNFMYPNNHFSFAHDDRHFRVIEKRNIPKSDWNNKIASYGMTVSHNETAGINEEAAGKLVIGGLIVGLGSLVAKSIRDLSDDRGSSSSSSSSSSKPKYNIVHSKGNVDLLSVNCEWSWGSGTTYISLRNRNSYDVYVTILYFNGDEMLETKKYKIYGGSILEEHVYYMCADDASITSVQ